MPFGRSDGLKQCWQTENVTIALAVRNTTFCSIIKLE